MTRREVTPDVEERAAWRRLQAGILVEAGLVPGPVAGRWQKAVQRGEFDADQCADDVLEAAAGGGDAARARVLDRSRTLMRDLVMTPTLQGARGAGRRARVAAKSGLALLVSQIVVLTVYTALLLTGVAVAALLWPEWGVDRYLDGLRSLFR